MLIKHIPLRNIPRNNTGCIFKTSPCFPPVVHSVNYLSRTLMEVAFLRASHPYLIRRFLRKILRQIITSMSQTFIPTFLTSPSSTDIFQSNFERNFRHYLYLALSNILFTFHCLICSLNPICGIHFIPCPFYLYLCSSNIFVCGRLILRIYVVLNGSVTVKIDGSSLLFKFSHSFSCNVIRMTVGVLFPPPVPLFRFGKGIRGIIVSVISSLVISRGIVGLFQVMYVTTACSTSKLPSIHKTMSINLDFLHS